MTRRVNQLAASLAADKGHCLALGSFFALSIQRQVTLFCSWINVIKIELIAASGS